MDVPFTILITQVLAMLVMLSVGYVSYRAHLLSDAGVGDLANVVMYVASPAVMVTSFLGAFRVEKLVNAGACALLTIVILLMCALVARIFCGGEGRISRFGVIFSNTGFVGIPLVQSILGQEYVLYVTVCIAVSIFFVWTYGVYLVTGSFQEVSLAKVLTNPAVTTLFLGFALFLLSVRLPDFLSVACSTLGSINTGGAMIVLDCGCVNPILIRRARGGTGTARRLSVSTSVDTGSMGAGRRAARSGRRSDGPRATT